MTDEKTPLHEQPFSMTIEHVFTIKGRGSVVVGKHLAGTLRKGDSVNVVNDTEIVATTVVTGIEMPNYGDQPPPDNPNPGLVLRGFTSDQVKPGMMLVAAEPSDAER